MEIADKELGWHDGVGSPPSALHDSDNCNTRCHDNVGQTGLGWIRNHPSTTVQQGVLGRLRLEQGISAIIPSNAIPLRRNKPRVFVTLR
jgi:hypothetical protein